MWYHNLSEEDRRLLAEELSSIAFGYLAAIAVSILFIPVYYVLKALTVSNIVIQITGLIHALILSLILYLLIARRLLSIDFTALTKIHPSTIISIITLILLSTSIVNLLHSLLGYEDLGLISNLLWIISLIVLAYTPFTLFKAFKEPLFTLSIILYVLTGILAFSIPQPYVYSVLALPFIFDNYSISRVIHVLIHSVKSELIKPEGYMRDYVVTLPDRARLNFYIHVVSKTTRGFLYITIAVFIDFLALFILGLISASSQFILINTYLKGPYESLSYLIDLFKMYNTVNMLTGIDPSLNTYLDMFWLYLILTITPIVIVGLKYGLLTMGVLKEIGLAIYDAESSKVFDVSSVFGDLKPSRLIRYSGLILLIFIMMISIYISLSFALKDLVNVDLMGLKLGDLLLHLSNVVTILTTVFTMLAIYVINIFTSDLERNMNQPVSSKTSVFLGVSMVMMGFTLFLLIVKYLSGLGLIKEFAILGYRIDDIVVYTFIISDLTLFAGSLFGFLNCSDTCSVLVEKLREE